MAESVDALVSNTSGATHPGSIPGLGTETEKVEKLSPFSFSKFRNILPHLNVKPKFFYPPKHLQVSLCYIHNTLLKGQTNNH